MTDKPDYEMLGCQSVSLLATKSAFPPGVPSVWGLRDGSKYHTPVVQEHMLASFALAVVFSYARNFVHYMQK